MLDAALSTQQLGGWRDFSLHNQLHFKERKEQIMARNVAHIQHVH